MPAKFLRDIYTNDLSKENADNEQINLFKMLGNATTRHTKSEKSELIENFIDEIRNDEKKTTQWNI